MYIILSVNLTRAEAISVVFLFYIQDLTGPFVLPDDVIGNTEIIRQGTDEKLASPDKTSPRTLNTSDIT